MRNMPKNGSKCFYDFYISVDDFHELLSLYVCMPVVSSKSPGVMLKIKKNYSLKNN